MPSFSYQLPPVHPSTSTAGKPPLYTPLRICQCVKRQYLGGALATQLSTS